LVLPYRLKRPPDPPAQLLREWKTQHPDTTSGESLITQARDRVHAWLNVSQPTTA
jgi:hypothetical protein